MNPLAYLRTLRPLLALTLSASVLLPSAQACTALHYTQAGETYLAKNHDFMIGNGLLIVNTRGRTKSSVTSPVPFTWEAQYGSVTYNQFGREFPNAGMNEAGLVVEMLWLDDTAYAPGDDRPTIGVLQWIQYQLDTASSVTEILNSDTQLRVDDPAGKVHFFVMDRSGHAAVIEWLEGRRMVYTGETLPLPVVANDRYDVCARGVLKGAAVTDPEFAALPSYGRAAAVAAQLDGARDPNPTAFGFTALEPAKHPEYTQWQVVYAPASARITLKRQADAQPIEIQFAQLDFAASAKPLAFDLTQAGPLQWSPCTPEINGRLVRTSYRTTPFLAHVPDAALDEIAAAPERFVARP